MGFNMKKLLIFSVMIAVSTVSAAAYADNNEEAKKAFVQGTKLFEQNKFAEAALSFQKAYDLRPSWKILANIGECSAAAKEYGVALEAFEAYLSQGGDEVPIDKRDNVVAEIRVLRELVGQLVAEAPDGADLIIDGIRRGRFPLPGPVLVSAGVNHDVKIEKDGKILIRKTMRINSGNTMELSATKPAAASSSETGPSTTEAPKATEDTSPTRAEQKDRTTDKDKGKGKKKGDYSKPLRVAAWTTTAVGLGLLAGGVVTGVLAMSSNSDYNNNKCGSEGCDVLRKKVKNLQVTTNVLLGEGGGVTAVGVALVIVSYVQQKKRSKQVTVLPSIDSKNLGLSLTYQF
jgi:hypothetical protein